MDSAEAGWGIKKLAKENSNEIKIKGKKNLGLQILQILRI